MNRFVQQQIEEKENQLLHVLTESNIQVLDNVIHDELLFTTPNG